MMRNLTTLLLLFLSCAVFSQTTDFQGYPVKSLNEPALDDQFSQWTVYQFDIQSFDNYVKTAGQDIGFNLKFGNLEWEIDLEPRNLKGPAYVLSILTDNGIVQQPSPENVTFRGQVKGKKGGNVSLTIHGELLYGYIENAGDLYFIEPLHYFKPGAPKDRFVLYAASDVKPKPGATCGFDELKHHTPQEESGAVQSAPEKMGCKLIQLAIASDLSMYNKYGSVIGVELHNIGVMNNVQNNYDNEFNDELQFSIVEQFVVSPPANDPWTNSTNAATLLNSFTNWGPSGFSQVHDLGQLWTNRDFQGGTIGIAWLGSVCTSSRYHCLQDFTNNANFLRVLTSHEIGHNFDAEHDASGSPTIMAPAVNNTNNWSNQSLNQINVYYPTRTCLSPCPSSVLPPVAAFSYTPGSGCAPFVVNYTDQSQNAPATWNWTFPGGTPASSNQQNPSVTYTSPGTYNATLTVANGGGSNTVTQTNIINVSAPPISSFNYSISGPTVFFFNLSTPSGLNYFWEFGDGQTSAQANPVHTYAQEGFYNVTLSVNNLCGTSSFLIPIAVFTPPVAGFTATPTTICAGSSVVYNDQSSPNTTNWSWSFPGGIPAASNLQSPVVTYPNPGVYSATLTASNPIGSNTSTQTNYITVNAGPSPGFTFSVNGSSVVFTNTSTNATSYSWNFGDGATSTQANPTHSFPGGGNYTVTLTATNNCGSSVTSQTVTITVPPIAAFTAAGASGCAPLTVTFTNNSPGATSFSWSFPGGTPSTSTAPNPTVVYSAAGTYSVTLVVTNSAGSNTVMQSNIVTAAPQPVPGFNSTTAGLTVSFTNTSTNATNYGWNFGDGETSTQTSPSHTYAEDGVYTVTLSATNNCGSVTTTQTVTIVTPPTAGFSANNTFGCAPLTVQFSNNSSGNATAWNWQFPGGNPTTSTAQNPSVTYAAAGTYTVTLTVSNAAGQNTSTQTNFITVTTTPAAGFNFTTNHATVTFSNTSANATGYSWNFGNGETSTQTNPSHTYASDGTYTVTLSATNACGTVTTTETVVIVTPPAPAFSASVTSGCAPMTVQFSNESSENSTSFVWEFPGGTPAASTLENPTVSYPTAGAYTVSLTVTNAAGANTSTETSFIVVSTVPVAGFTAGTNVFVANFTNTTTNGTSYSWDFGDGETSTAANPSHTYAGDGTYTVTLTATNACGTDVFTQDVVVTSLPQAGFSASATSGCAPFTVQFNDQSSSNTTSWNWSFPGGTPSSSTQQNPTVTYSAPGTYTVTLVSGNSLGENTLTQSDFVVVNTTPVAGFSSSTDLLNAVFENTSTGATGYTWNFGDGETSTAENPSHTYAEDGTYTVTLTAENACGTVTSTQTVTVVSLPTAGFSASASQGCLSFTVQFTNESSENATGFAWQFPGGMPATSTEENPVVTYASAGTYPVTLTVTNAAGQDVVTQTDMIVVNTVPNAGFTVTSDGLIISITNTSTNATSYVWNFGNGETSTDETPVFTYDIDGVYNLTLTATNECGSVTVNDQLVISTPPTAGFSAAQTTGCAPFTVAFSNESSDNSATFAWSFPGGSPATSTAQNPVVTYAAEGIYSVTLTVSNPAGNDTYTLDDLVKVTALPAAGFDFEIDGQSVDFTNSTINATTYSWNFGDGETSQAEAPSHTYAADGIYNVTLTAENGCGSVVVTQTVVVATAAPIAIFSAGTTTGCNPLTVAFENLSSANAETFEWSFPGGTPATSTEANPVVVYNTPGVYDVTLTAGNTLGSNTATETEMVVVNGVPSAGFNQTVNGNTVVFSNNSANAISYQWNFGDGNSSMEENPEHTYQQSGEYEVTLSAENSCGFSSATVSIQVIVTSVEEIPGISEFQVVPNPNGGRFTMILKGEPQSSLELNFVNLLGQRLLYERADFRSGQLTREFSFETLPAGLYILQVKSGEKALFKKVIVE